MSDSGDGPQQPDVLVVDIGPRGMRARRQIASGGRSARVDVPTLRGDAPIDEAELVASVLPLLPDVPPPVATVWAVPSLGRVVDAPRLLGLLEGQIGAGRSVVVDHAVATLAGALDAVGPGVVIDMGVAVTALATDFDQVWHRIDGWGFALGDRGSAAWLGAQGLAAALRHRDGVPGGSAALHDAARRSFGDERTWPHLLAEHGDAAVCADFAPMVGEVARRDASAEGLVRVAAEHLADTLCAGAVALPGAPLAATGGLLLIDPVKRAFAAALGRRQVFLVPAVGDSLAGTTVIAGHLAGGRRLPHRPPHLYVAGQAALGA